MALTRINKLKSHRIFRDFTWPADLPDLGQYNLIYGWNGSGKSTLSAILRLLEAKAPCDEGSVSLRVNGLDINGADFATVTDCVRVFNRDFVAESVFNAGDTLAPIYVVGKENVEKQKELDRKRKDLFTNRAKLSGLRDNLKKAEKAEDDLCVDKGRVVKDYIGGGGNRYSSYNKARFRQAISQISSPEQATAATLGDADKSTYLQQAKSSPKARLQQPDYSFPDLKELARITTTLVTRSITSEAIEELKQHPDVAQWVQVGHALHRSRDETTCLYCQNTISNERQTALDKHFSTALDKLNEELTVALQQVRTAAELASSFAAPNKAELYEELSPEYERQRSAVQNAIDAVAAPLREYANALETKKARPFDTDLSVPSPVTPDSTLLEALTQTIAKHNAETESFQQRIETAHQAIEASVAGEAFVEHSNRRQAVDKAQHAIQEAESALQSLQADIDKLEAEIISFREPADELTRDLHAYLGHKELTLEIEGTGYKVARYGEKATALSEGEKTAIALLYFLRSLTDRDFDLNSGVVVLDDPVSSLDANALFNAFGFIKERTRGIGQIIIMTHNFTFFRQVKNWFYHLPKQRSKDISKRPARFYMISVSAQDGKRSAVLCKIDRLLVAYESEYHFLFKTVLDTSRATGAGKSLEDYYAVPNVARRLMESFLSFRVPHEIGDVLKRLDSIDCDPTRKARVHRFLNTYSHRDGVVEQDHDPSVLSETPGILADLLALIESVDKEHYDGMVKLAELGDGEAE